MRKWAIANMSVRGCQSDAKPSADPEQPGDSAVEKNLDFPPVPWLKDNFSCSLGQGHEQSENNRDALNCEMISEVALER